MTDAIERTTMVGTDKTPQQMAHQIDELSRAVRERPRDDGAWLALAEVLHDGAQRRYSLDRALALNPANTRAQRLLTALNQPGFEDRLATLTATPTITPGALRSSTPGNALAERISGAQLRVAALQSAQVATLPMPQSLAAMSASRPHQSSAAAPAITLRPFNMSELNTDEATPLPTSMTHEALLLLDAVSSPPVQRRHSSLRDRVSEALIIPTEVAEARPRAGIVLNPARRYRLLGSLVTSAVMALVLFASLLTVSPLLG